MDWKQLHEQFHAFASECGAIVDKSDVSQGEGKVSYYRLIEKGEVYYELKHSKPISEYGSKLRIYTKAEGDISVNAKSRILGGPVIKANSTLSNQLGQKLIMLARNIGSFQWSTGPHHKGWPEVLGGTQVLTFECKFIDLAVAELQTIRSIHLEFLKG